MRRFIGISLLAVALLQLGFRGMQRARHDIPLWDFASVHSAVRTWIHGGDPYDLSAVVATWREAKIFTGRDASYFATVYPPTSLLLIVPLALLPAGVAMWLWLLLTLVLLAIQFAALMDMARLSWRDSRGLLLVGAALVSAPFQFGILAGQLSIPAISLCIIAFWCAGNRKERLAGVILGLASALKPQLGGPLIIYYLVQKRQSIAGPAVVCGTMILLIAVAAMRISHIGWIAGWTHSIALTTQPGNVNDYGRAAPFRDEIVDLKMLVVSLIDDSRALRAAIGLIELALVAWYVRSFLKREKWNERIELVALAGFSGLILLPIYHRVYDMALLSTALAWALAELDGPARRRAIGLLIPMAVFLIPFDIVKSVGTRFHQLGEISRTGWWQAMFAPHYAWGLLALTIGLIWVMGRPSRSDSSPSDVAF
jgi:hypothetical protein